MVKNSFKLDPYSAFYNIHNLVDDYDLALFVYINITEHIDCILKLIVVKSVLMRVEGPCLVLSFFFVYGACIVSPTADRRESHRKEKINRMALAILAPLAKDRDP